MEDIKNAWFLLLLVQVYLISPYSFFWVYQKGRIAGIMNGEVLAIAGRL